MARLVLTCEEGSAAFTERVLTLQDGGQVPVARADGGDGPAEDNVVFESKVSLIFGYILCE